MEWRHSGLPRPPKIPIANSAGKFLSSIFGIKKASSTLIIFQRTKLSTRSITHLCWCNWRTFWRKNAAGISARYSWSCTKMPWLPGICHPEQTGLPGLPATWSTTLFSGSGPVGLPHVPWTEKKTWKFAIFLPKRWSLLPWRPGWTENFCFFSGLEKLEQRVEKGIELRGEYVLKIVCLVAVACILPGRGKDLSAHLAIVHKILQYYLRYSILK